MSISYDRMAVGPLATNCYIAYCEKTRSAMIIDPGYEKSRIVSRVNALDLRVLMVVCTHGHFDHVTDAEAVASEFDVHIYLNSADRQLHKFVSETKDLCHGDKLTIGNVDLEVIQTPGHTKGSLCLYNPGLLFSGDTLFCGGIGRTDLPGGSYREIISSIRTKILTLPAETIVLPGHGSSTTVDEEADSF